MIEQVKREICCSDYIYEYKGYPAEHRAVRRGKQPDRVRFINRHFWNRQHAMRSWYL